MKAQNPFSPAVDTQKERYIRPGKAGRALRCADGGQEWIANYLYDYDVPPQAPSARYWRNPTVYNPTENPFSVTIETWSC